MIDAKLTTKKDPHFPTRKLYIVSWKKDGHKQHLEFATKGGALHFLNDLVLTSMGV